ncbi:MAG: hypothetical protein ACP5LA_07310, partial [Thermoplasmata archaeon]
MNEIELKNNINIQFELIDNYIQEIKKILQDNRYNIDYLPNLYYSLTLIKSILYDWTYEGII